MFDNLEIISNQSHIVLMNNQFPYVDHYLDYRIERNAMGPRNIEFYDLIMN